MRQLLHILIILIFTLLGLNLTLSLPFYYSWDMDLITLTDLLLLKDNMMPAHINHPGLGMYWLLMNAQSLATVFGLVTDVSFNNLFDSVEPMLLIGELSQMMRIVNSLTCMGIAVMLWASFKNYFRNNVVLEILLLVVFCSLPGFWKYDLLMVRTEIYALFFWSCALFFTLRAAEEDKTTYNTLLAGFFAGLSFFTKIQAFFLLPLLVFFYIWKQERTLQPRTIFTYRFWMFLGVFLLFTFASIFAFLPPYKADFADRYWVNKFFLVFIAALYLIKRLQKIEKFAALTQFLSAFTAGSLMVVFLPLLSGLSWESAIRYGFLNFKVLFLRITKFDSVGQFNILENAAGLFINNWLYVLIGFGFLAFAWLKNGKKYSLIFISVILLFQFLLGARVNLQDSLWIEIPFVVVTVLLLNKINKYVTLASASVLLLFNVYKITGFEKYHLEEPIAYYDGIMYFQGVFVKNEYIQPMQKRYSNLESQTNALQLASRVDEIKDILFVNFSSTNLTLRDAFGSKNYWALRLAQHKESSLKVLYRPDQTQKIYWPADYNLGDVQVENCEKISVPEVEMNSTKFNGFALRGLRGKGRETPVHCLITAKDFTPAFITIEHIPQATFVGY